MFIRWRPGSNPRGLRIAFAAAACLGCSVPIASAATVTFTVERARGSLVMEASAELHANPAVAWQVLTDYDRYGDFIPDVTSSRIVARHGSRVTVLQSTAIGLWWLRMPVRVVYDIVESPPDRLDSRAVASALPVLESGYVLTPVGRRVRLSYIGHVAAGSSFFRRIETQAVEQNLVSQFQALSDEIERRGAATSDPGARSVP